MRDSSEIMKNNAIKECVILSGKGGTGKTSLCAGLMHLSSQSTAGVYVDADVDAANLALVVNAQKIETNRFTGSQIAFIDPDLCIGCGICFDVCRFEAIQKPVGDQVAYQVIDLLCEGCASCFHQCPVSAVQMEIQQDGEWYHSSTTFGHLFHAELFPAAENSGKLVAEIKQKAKAFAEEQSLHFMLVDGPPGIGCPVISASTGADLALLVAEPGVSGLNDLGRIIQTLEHFKIPIQICINKADLYPEGALEIRQLAEAKGYPITGEIPFDSDIPKAMIQGQPITVFDSTSLASKEIQKIWRSLENALWQTD